MSEHPSPDLRDDPAHSDAAVQSLGQSTQAKSAKHLDIALFVIVTVLMVLVLVMLSANIISQYVNYKGGIASVFAGKEFMDHSAIIAYSRSWDFAIIKTSSFFLSVLVILIGSLYVLRVARFDITVSAQTEFFRGAFSTSSPGLTMVLLGVVLAVFSLNYKSEIGYDSGAPAAVEMESKPRKPNAPHTPEPVSGTQQRRQGS